MYFSKEYIDQNYEMVLKKIKDIGGAAVYWLEDPTRPALVSLVRILGGVYSYKRYVAKSLEVSSAEDQEEIPQLTTEMQTIQFLNYAFVPVAPIEDSAYEEKDITMKHVLGIANLYTEMMINKTVQLFSAWCKKKDILMLNAPFTRKRRVVNGEISSNKIRKVYVLKKEYLGGIVKGIVGSIPNYQKHIKSLKEQRFSIIGYARKAPGNEEEKTRIELLQKMMNCLSNKSLVDKVFVSSCCSTSDPLASRDLKDNPQILDKISNATGNTQDLINYLNTTDEDVCLIAIDYTGLSTNLYIFNFK